MKEIKQELYNILLKTSSKIPFSIGKTNRCTFLVVLLKTHGISDNTVAVSTPNSRLWSLNMFLTKINQGPLENAYYKPAQKMHKISLGRLDVLENKKAIRDY